MKAVQRDPNFGAAYAAMAIASANVGQQQEAEQHVKEALRHLDGMTERERYRVRGLFYYITGDYQACVKEYGDLVARYAADAAAHNNLALCSTKLRNVPLAVEEMRRVVDDPAEAGALPRESRALCRLRQRFPDRGAGGPNRRRTREPLGCLRSCARPAGTGAGAVWRQTPTTDLRKLDELGVSQAASGLGDLAIYEGRFADAVRILSSRRGGRYRVEES